MSIKSFVIVSLSVLPFSFSAMGNNGQGYSGPQLSGIQIRQGDEQGVSRELATTALRKCLTGSDSWTDYIDKESPVGQLVEQLGIFKREEEATIFIFEESSDNPFGISKIEIEQEYTESTGINRTHYKGILVLDFANKKGVAGKDINFSITSKIPSISFENLVKGYGAFGQRIEKNDYFQNIQIEIPQEEHSNWKITNSDTKVAVDLYFDAQGYVDCMQYELSNGIEDIED